MKEKISIVVPCYNEQEALPIFYETIKPILKQLPTEHEIILVNDGSKDNTANIMKELAKQDKNVKYILFSRNFGKEAAMYAGLNGASGNYVAIMDVDLQDPPEKLIEMYQLIKQQDYDCIATRRVTRKGEPKIRSWFARQFYKLINKWTQVEIVDGARDYRLMKKEMVDAILSMKETNRFSKGLFGYVGFNTKWLEYENIERCAGETKWNFKKLFVYAVEGIVAFTLAPLYAIVKIGIALAILDILATLILLIIHLIGYYMFYPWVILLLSIIFLVSIVISCMGITAIYQAKIYGEVKNRPIYITKETNLK